MTTTDFRLDDNGIPVYIPYPSAARRITDTEGSSIGAYLAISNGQLGLAWNDDSTGKHNIHFQLLDMDGNALAGERQLTRTDADSMIPAIEPVADGFVLAWGEVSALVSGHDGLASNSRSEIVALKVSP